MCHLRWSSLYPLLLHTASPWPNCSSRPEALNLGFGHCFLSLDEFNPCSNVCMRLGDDFLHPGMPWHALIVQRVDFRSWVDLVRVDYVGVDLMTIDLVCTHLWDDTTNISDCVEHPTNILSTASCSSYCPVCCNSKRWDMRMISMLTEGRRLQPQKCSFTDEVDVNLDNQFVHLLFLWST